MATTRQLTNIQKTLTFIKDEAKHWQFRASHVFKLGQYKSCIECVNLALKYTPGESTGIFSRLLSQRSEAEQRLSEYTSGLEDAKKASMMTADMLEVSKAEFNYPFSCNCKWDIYKIRKP